MAVVPAKQRAGRLLELFLHPVPQTRHHDFGLVAVNRLAELQRLVDDAVQHASFRIAIDVADEKTEDRLRGRALEVFLQGDHSLLLEKDRIGRAPRRTPGSGGSRCGRRIPQDRAIHWHRLRAGIWSRAHFTVSRMIRATRSPPDLPACQTGSRARPSCPAPGWWRDRRGD